MRRDPNNKKDQSMKKFNSRFVEQWINDTLKECEGQNLPGTLLKPEHKLPLSRYNIDRITLTNWKVPNEMVDRIYRCLFVYTLGFYALLKEATQSLDTNRITVQAKIWKVYHILLEYACETDYKLVTQQMETLYQEQIADMEVKFRNAIEILEASESEIKTQLKQTQKYCDNLESEKCELDKEKMRIHGEFQKNAMKHEEEVQLRLMFESKLNSLHHVNRELNSKYSDTQDELQREQFKNNEISGDYEQLQETYTQLLTTFNETQQALNLSKQENTILKNANQQYMNSGKDQQYSLDQYKKRFSALRDQQEHTQKDFDKSSMEVKNLENFINAKSKEEVHETSIMNDIKDKREQLEQIVEQKQQKILRQMDKLRFYKAQYVGFQAIQKQSEDTQKLLRLEILQNNKLIQEQKDQHYLLNQYHHQLQQSYEILDKQNEETLERVRLENIVRHDLDHKLKSQIDQSQQIFDQMEKLYNDFESSKQEVCELEKKCKELDDDKKDLHMDYIDLEAKFQAISEKYNTLNVTLRQQCETEKESRTNWKEKFEKEALSLKYVQQIRLMYKVFEYRKQLGTLQMDFQDIKLKNQIIDKELDFVKKERDQLKKIKDQLQLEYSEWFENQEIVSRELSSKTNILDDFDKLKKNEINQYKAKIGILERELDQFVMREEDIASDVLRWKGKFKDQIRKVDSMSQKVKQVQSMKKGLDEKILQQQIQIENLDDTIAKVTSRNQEVEAINEAYQAEAKYLQGHIATLKQKLENIDDVKKQLQSQIDSQSREYEKIIEERDELRELSLAVSQSASRIDKETQCLPTPRLDQGIQTDIIVEKVNKIVLPQEEYENTQTNIESNLSQRTSVYTQPNSYFDKTHTYGKVISKIEDCDDSQTPTSQGKESEVQRKMKPVFGRTMMRFNDIRNGQILEEDLQQTEDGANLVEKKRSGTSHMNSRNVDLTFQQNRRMGTAMKVYSDALIRNDFGSRSSSTAEVSQRQLMSNFVINKDISHQSFGMHDKQRMNQSSYNSTTMKRAITPQIAGNSRIKRMIKNAFAVKIDFSLADQPIDREVSEFPYSDNRLKDIDYKSIIASQKEWVDPYFKPDINAIYDETMVRPDRIKNWSTFVWKRPKEVYGKGKYTVFKDIGPSDIKQGYCGDCYYLSAISSLAEFEQRVKDIFITEEVNDSGCYSMYFYVNGEKKEVVVDDYFPYDNHKQTWAFSRSNNEKEIWVLLLEKAWAKIYGSYQRIEAGTTGEALTVLTGAPTSFIYHKEKKTKKDEFWKTIRDADQKNFIIATAVSSGHTEGQKSNVDMKNVGLVDAHAYSLISTHEIQDQGKAVKLIKIRNPWGFKEWTGDWSDKSSKWTTETKSQLQFEDKDDGVFYISYDDYFSFFYITTICKYTNESDVSEIADVHSKDGYSVVEFNNPKDCDTPVVFCANQIHARFVDETMRGNYKYAPIKFILTKIVESKDSQGKTYKEQVFLDGDYMQYQHAHIQVPKLTQGDYVMYTKAEWDPTNIVRRLVMNIYAPDPYTLRRASTKKYQRGVFQIMEDWLNQRLIMGVSYEVPVCSTIEEEDPQELKNLKWISINLSNAQQGEKIFYKYDQYDMEDREQKTVTSQEQVLELIPRSIISKSHELSKEFYGLNLDVIRQPFHQPKSLAKPKKVVKGNKKIEPSICSGINLTIRKHNNNEIIIDIKANNERDVFCIENLDCPQMLVDLEVSCSSLRQNIVIKNLSVLKGEKKLRQFNGIINPETNSCFKYHIRPAIVNLNNNNSNDREMQSEQVDQEEEDKVQEEGLIQPDEMESVQDKEEEEETKDREIKQVQIDIGGQQQEEFEVAQRH